MRSILAPLALVLLAACSPPSSGTSTARITADANGPEAVVQAIYAEVGRHIGTSITPNDAIPMTEDLKALMERAETAAEARHEPFLEGDLAADCQDCTSLTELAISPAPPAMASSAPAGHTVLQAHFKLNGNEERSVFYDLTDTPAGWRVDNIFTEAFNLRTESQAYLAETSTTH